MTLSKSAQSAVMLIARWIDLEESGQVISPRCRRKTDGEEAEKVNEKPKKQTLEERKGSRSSGGR